MSGVRSLLGVLVAALLAPLPATAGPLRVVAFGDSLTMGQGSTHGAGYRLAFLERMRAAGYDVDMLGQFHSGPEGMDGDHEGYPGRGVAKLDDVSFRAMRRDHPDAVLLLIGTNDAKNSTFQPDSFRIRFSVLLDRTLSESRMHLVVSTIPPSRYGKGKRDQVKVAVNKIVREEVEKRRAEGKHVRLIDSYAMLDDRHDFVDTLHMNDAGYAKVGNAFADALIELLHAYPVPAAGAAEAAASADPGAGPGEDGDAGAPGEGGAGGAGAP